MTCEQNRLLKEIGILDFALIEIVLYLDTHPCDQEAMRYFSHYNRLKKEKRKEYSTQFGPLTLDDAMDKTEEFLWTIQPWPWEGGNE